MIEKLRSRWQRVISPCLVNAAGCDSRKPRAPQRPRIGNGGQHGHRCHPAPDSLTYCGTRRVKLTSETVLVIARHDVNRHTAG